MPKTDFDYLEMPEEPHVGSFAAGGLPFDLLGRDADDVWDEIQQAILRRRTPGFRIGGIEEERS